MIIGGSNKSCRTIELFIKVYLSPWFLEPLFNFFAKFAKETLDANAEGAFPALLLPPWYLPQLDDLGCMLVIICHVVVKKIQQCNPLIENQHHMYMCDVDLGHPRAITKMAQLLPIKKLVKELDRPRFTPQNSLSIFG